MEAQDRSRGWQQFRILGYALVAALLCFGGLVYVVLCWVFGDVQMVLWTLGLAVGSGYWCKICIDRYSALGRALSTIDHELLDGFGRGRRSFVKIRVVIAGGVRGVDRGVLFEDDGRLCFVGHRTSFALGGGDLLGVRRFPDFSASMGQVVTAVFLLTRQSEEDVRLEIDCLAEKSGRYPYEVEDFDELLTQWTQNCDRTEQGQFPPLEPGPV